MSCAAAKAGSPAVNRQLSRSLASAIGIVAAESVVFAVSVIPLAVGIHLVGGHHHHGAGVLEWFESFEQIQGPLHVGAPGAQGICVAAPHQGLGTEVEHHLRFGFVHRSNQGFRISQVGQVVMQLPYQTLCSGFSPVQCLE